MVTVSNARELLDASLACIAGEIEYKSINVLDSFCLTIKIDGEEWQDSSNFDYKSALIVEAIQRDILGVFNAISGASISLAQLDNHQDLIVKVQIKDGCLEYIVKGIKYVLKYAEAMTPEQRLKLAALVLAMIACGTLPWAASSMFSSWANIQIEKYKSVPAVIESIGKAEKIVSGNRRIQRVVIEHSSDKTTVSVGGDDALTVEDIKKYSELDPQAELPVSYYVDGNYAVQKYDFDGQQASLKIGKRNEWVSTSFLANPEKEKLKAMASKAIDEGRGQRADLQVSIQVLNGEIVGAAIMGFGAKRTNSVALSDALKTKQERKRQPQASLLKHVTPEGHK